MNIKVGVLGATGYAGAELVRLLYSHPNTDIVFTASNNFAGKNFSDLYKNFEGLENINLEITDMEKIKSLCDVVFTALPHGVSNQIIPKLVEMDMTVIDLSGDFRYNDAKLYEQWYGIPHSNPHLLEQSVYGLCELHRDEIKKSALIGNPGCYTTCSILPLVPLLQHKSGLLISADNIIIDAKSGISGAGRTAALDYNYCESADNIKAYKIACHRHTSEIEQELSLLAGQDIKVSFTPHLIPVKRGILSTVYCNLTQKKSTAELVSLYKQYFSNEFFVKIYDEGTLPEIKNVVHSNFVHMGLMVDERLNRVIIVSVLDNLIKGAAGQAIQNMNIKFGLDERKGLDFPGTYL